MTLEGLFTWSEMNNGIISSTQVNDLISFMHKESECDVKNINDTTKQWSLIANAISATENQDFLHQFIELDGLKYLNRWLNVAENFKSDTFVEDSIVNILQALERVEVNDNDGDKLISSGILMTVKEFIGHSNSKVNVLAETLFNKWSKVKENDVIVEDDVTENLESVNGDIKEKEEDDKSLVSETLKDDDVSMTHTITDSLEQEGVEEEELDIPELDSTENVKESSEKVDEVEVTKSNESIDDENASKSVKEDGDYNSETSENMVEKDESEGSLGKESEIAKSSTYRRDNDKKSDLDLDYGIVDALELARQVANEVEREVDYCSDQSSSSSEEDLSSKVVLTVENMETEDKNDEDLRKSVSGFDLNEEMIEEEIMMTHPVISVVSASRAEAVTDMPVSGAPLQFEGTLGWRSSASTSAFRVVPENETFISKQGLLDFDLNNVADTVEEISVPVPSQITSPRMLELDLNQLGGADDNDGGGGGAPPVWRPNMYNQLSSGSSSLMNFDLNDQPIFGNNNNLSSSGNGIKSDESVISIMGIKVDMNQKNSIPLTNGRNFTTYTPEGVNDVNFVRNGGMFTMGSPVPPYPPPHVYGYNGVTAGHGMQMPYASSAMYGFGGPIPYMMDTRGGPYVVPNQMNLGSGSSSSVLAPTFTQPPPFMFTLAGTPPTLNGGGGGGGGGEVILDNNNNSGGGGFRQFLNPGHLNNNSTSSSNSGGGKRKEPEGGWDPYSYPPPFIPQPWR